MIPNRCFPGNSLLPWSSLDLPSPRPPRSPGAGGSLGLRGMEARSPKIPSSRGRVRRRGTARSANAGISWSATTGRSTSGTPATIATGPRPCRWATRPRPTALHWTRDPHNPIFHESWVEDMCVVKQDGIYQMFAEGKNDIAHRLTSTDGAALDRARAARHPQDRRLADQPRALRHAGRLVRERDVVPLLRARRPGRLAGHVSGPQDLDQRQGRPGHRLRAGAYDSAAVALNQVVKRGGVLLRLLSRQCAAALEGLDKQRRPLARPGALGEIPRKPDHQEQLLEPHPRRHAQGDRLYTMHPDVRAFEPAATGNRTRATPQR